MIAVQNVAPVNANFRSPADILRTRIQAELAGMTKQLAGSNLNDALTVHIRNWKNRFSTALAHQNVQHVLNENIRLLQELLRDPFHAPFDQNSVLGSDGIAYGQMSLTLHLQSVPAQYRNRSPMNPNDPTPFTTAPHPNIQYMVQWLESHHALVHDAEIENRYQQLRNQNNAPQIPVAPPAANSVEARLARIFALQAARENANQKALNEQAAKAEAQVNQYVQNVNAINVAHEQNVKNQVDRIQNIDQNFQANLQRVNQAIENMDKQIVDLEADHEAVIKQNEDVKKKISDVQQQDNQLAQLIKEAELEIKKRQQQMWKDIALAVVIVGGCAFGSWALAGVLQGSGIGMSVGTTAGGGGKLGIILAVG